MKNTPISHFRKNAFFVLLGTCSALLAGAAHSHGLSSGELDKLGGLFYGYSKESQDNNLKMNDLKTYLEKCNKEINYATNMKFHADREKRAEDALAMGKKLEEWSAKKDKVELELDDLKKKRREIDKKNGLANVGNRKSLGNEAAHRRPNNGAASERGQKIESAAPSTPSISNGEQESIPSAKKFSRDFFSQNSQNDGAEKNTRGDPPKVGTLNKTLLEGVNEALQKAAPNGPEKKLPNVSAPQPPAPSGLGQRISNFGDLFAKLKPPSAVTNPSDKVLTPVAESVVGPAVSASSASGWAGAAPMLPANQHVALSALDSLVIAPGQAPDPQESLVVTNHLGNTHGVWVGQDKLVLSGGLHSTNLRLDDDGAKFVDAQTGAAVVLGGVAAGVAPTDAVNVEQVHSVVDAAVTPLGARFDGLDSRVQQLDQKINAVEKKLSGGVAMAMALSQPVSFAPKANSAVTGGVATYNGQTAMGFSFNRLVANTETRRTVVSLGVAATTSGRSSACARVGACFSW